MANDDFVNNKIEEYLATIASARTANELRGILRLFSKEVERETRHKAAEMAMELHNKIMNL